MTRRFERAVATMEKLLIFGGDARQLALYPLLCPHFDLDITGFGSGDTVSAREALEDLAGWRYIALPVPYERGGRVVMANGAEVQAGALLRSLSPAQTVFLGATGGCSPETRAKTINFMTDAAYVRKNAENTADILYSLLTGTYGAVAEETRALVCGYGRIARRLCSLLAADGASVTVAARRSEVRAEAAARYGSAIDTAELAEHIGGYTLVLNTVPARIIGEAALLHVSRGALLIDVASAPHGWDAEAAARLKVNARLEPGLPGRYMPKAEAAALAEIIIREGCNDEQR